MDRLVAGVILFAVNLSSLPSPIIKTRMETSYLPYMFISVEVAEKTANTIFDQLTAKFRKNNDIDPDDLFTKQNFSVAGNDNPDRLHVQYIDKHGAKFGMGLLTLNFADPNHFLKVDVTM